MAVSKLVAVRLPDELLERLDEYARGMEKLHGLKAFPLSTDQIAWWSSG